MNDLERFELLEAYLEELEKLAQDHIILIEGNKDRRALEKLISGDFQFIEVQRDGGPIRAAEMVSESGLPAVIFTDWDKKGILLAHELESQLRSLEVSFNSELRRKFSSVSRKDIKDVESLASLYARLYDIAKGNPSGF